MRVLPALFDLFLKRERRGSKIFLPLPISWQKFAASISATANRGNALGSKHLPDKNGISSTCARVRDGRMLYDARRLENISRDMCATSVTRGLVLGADIYGIYSI